MHLKYLFTATFADGSVIEQSADDRSVLEPETRSQFYDVLQRAERIPLETFVLNGEGNSYGVDLRDGHFVVNGVPFRMIEGQLPEYKLIFFRQHTHDFEPSGKETRHDIVYRMGWQCTEDGKNFQRVMQIE